MIYRILFSLCNVSLGPAPNYTKGGMSTDPGCPKFSIEDGIMPHKSSNVYIN